jgi:hypothetical protein
MRKLYENMRESTESTSVSSSTSSSFARSPIHVLFYRLLPDESPYHLKSTRSSFADFHEKPQADMREPTDLLSTYSVTFIAVVLFTKPRAISSSCSPCESPYDLRSMPSSLKSSLSSLASALIQALFRRIVPHPILLNLRHLPSQIVAFDPLKSS